MALLAGLAAGAGAQSPAGDMRAASPQQEQASEADARARRADTTAPMPRPEPRQESGAVNPASGQYYPPAGNGDVINPATGERYLGVPGGYVNPNTGELVPRIR